MINQQTGIGVIIRNEDGTSIAGLSDSLFCESVEIGEASALLEGVKLALELRITDCLIASDSLTCISELKAIKGLTNWKL